eukprot:jgi/Chlat1/7886/Chrsp66S07345
MTDLLPAAGQPVAIAPATDAGVLLAAETPDETHPYQYSLQVPYATAAAASIIRNTLSVDKELRPAQVSRVVTVEGTVLHVDFRAKDVKVLRGSIGGFLDALALATRTLEKFGAPVAA